MPPGLRRIEAPASHPNASKAYDVIQDGQPIGTVVLVLNRRPTGATLRRDWWAIAPATDTRPLPRPFDTRASAVAAIRYRHATLTTPRLPDPIDATLRTIVSAYAHAGPNAAVWLAASVTIHHLIEMDANRSTNPPALWRELRRIIGWLQAATGQEPDRSSAGYVSYRRIADRPGCRRTRPHRLEQAVQLDRRVMRTFVSVAERLLLIGRRRVSVPCAFS